MSESANQAVFLSYASQDAEAARRISESLRSSGVEVWFDADGGLEHGDEWGTSKGVEALPVRGARPG